MLEYSMTDLHKKSLKIIKEFTQLKISNDINKKLLSKLQNAVDEKKTIARDCIIRKDNHKLAIKVLQKITNDRNKTAKLQIENMINAALSSVFIGQGYTVKIDEKPWGDYMTATLLLVEGNGKERSLAHGSGDGIKQIISFLCNVLIIKFTGCSRIVISDELFDRLSPEYARIMSDILVKLADELDFQFILIEHNPQLWSNDEVTLIRVKKTVASGLIIENEDELFAV